MLSIANLTPTTAVRINGAVQTLSQGLSVLSHRAAASCPAPSASTVHPTFMVLARTCNLEVEVQGSADVKVLQFMHLLPDATLSLRVNASALNDAKAASAGTDTQAVLDVPLHVQLSSVDYGSA